MRFIIDAELKVNIHLARWPPTSETIILYVGEIPVIAFEKGVVQLVGLTEEDIQNLKSWTIPIHPEKSCIEIIFPLFS